MYQLRFKLSIKRMAMEFGHGQNFTLQNMRAVLYIYIYISEHVESITNFNI